ncbi:MAG: dTDP-4-dehydrorhamnose 3,5-epimerase family protein [Bdellovibrionota bacterium]
MTTVSSMATASGILLPSKIYDVIIQELKVHKDKRGYFKEVFCTDWKVFIGINIILIAQTYMKKDVIKAWHFHHTHYDVWHFSSGLARVILYDDRKESPTYGASQEFLVGDPQKYPEAKALCIRIPPGVLHACEVISKEGATLVYATDKAYDPTDEGRYPWNDERFNVTWKTPNPVVSESDTKYYTPPHKRALIC